MMMRLKEARGVRLTYKVLVSAKLVAEIPNRSVGKPMFDLQTDIISAVRAKIGSLWSSKSCVD